MVKRPTLFSMQRTISRSPDSSAILLTRSWPRCFRRCKATMTLSVMCSTSRNPIQSAPQSAANTRGGTKRRDKNIPSGTCCGYCCSSDFSLFSAYSSDFIERPAAASHTRGLGHAGRLTGETSCSSGWILSSAGAAAAVAMPDRHPAAVDSVAAEEVSAAEGRDRAGNKQSCEVLDCPIQSLLDVTLDDEERAIATAHFKPPPGRHSEDSG
jgi:hypothetical protein